MHRPRHRRRGFSLIELLVVVAIIALLISILLPSLSAAREQGKVAKCLNNLSGLAKASNMYAADFNNLVIPIANSQYNNAFAFGGSFWWRVGTPFAWGGRTATEPVGNFTQIMDPNGPWAVHTRPLNRFMMNGLTEADTQRGATEQFYCPSDTGYPNRPDWVKLTYVGDTNETYEKTLFNIAGNSYRMNTAGIVITSGSIIGGGWSVGPWGSKLDRLSDPGKLILYAEPLFYVMTIPEQNLDPNLAPLTGFHKKLMTENLAMVDGSGRTTRVGRIATWAPQELAAMNVIQSPIDALRYLRRGTNWRTDSYPTPGSLIRARSASGADQSNGAINYGNGQDGWPFHPYQDNLRPL